MTRGAAWRPCGGDPLPLGRRRGRRPVWHGACPPAGRGCGHGCPQPGPPRCPEPRAGSPAGCGRQGAASSADGVLRVPRRLPLCSACGPAPARQPPGSAFGSAWQPSLGSGPRESAGGRVSHPHVSTVSSGVPGAVLGTRSPWWPWAGLRRPVSSPASLPALTVPGKGLHLPGLPPVSPTRPPGTDRRGAGGLSSRRMWAVPRGCRRPRLRMQAPSGWSSGPAAPGPAGRGEGGLGGVRMREPGGG